MTPMNHVEASETQPSVSGKAFRERTGWLQIGLVAALICALYYDILGRLVLEWWNNPNFSHGFLVPLFSAFLVWQNRKRISVLDRKPTWFGIVVVAGAMATLIVGELGAEFFLSRVSLLFLLAGLVLSFLGWRHFRAMLFAWAFLFFMVPIPVIIFNQIAFPLQFMAAKLASSLLTLWGIPVLREGNILVLPTLTLEVAEACSGIRSLMSLGALAVIYGYFLEKRTIPRVLLGLSAIPVAIAANALRIMGTGMLGYYWNPDKAEGFFHEFSGWVIFVASLLLLFAIHAVIRRVWKMATSAWGAEA